MKAGYKRLGQDAPQATRDAGLLVHVGVRSTTRKGAQSVDVLPLRGPRYGRTAAFSRAMPILRTYTSLARKYEGCRKGRRDATARRRRSAEAWRLGTGASPANAGRQWSADARDEPDGQDARGRSARGAAARGARSASGARRRDMVGRFALLAADALAVVAAWLIVASPPVLRRCTSPGGSRRTSRSSRCWRRRPGSTTATSSSCTRPRSTRRPTLVGVAAIYALTIEGVQAFLYTGGSHPLPIWAILTVALVAFGALGALRRRPPPADRAGARYRRRGDRGPDPSQAGGQSRPERDRGRSRRRA